MSVRSIPKELNAQNRRWGTRHRTALLPPLRTMMERLAY